MQNAECIAAHLAVLYERYLYHVRRVQAAQPGPGVLCGGDGEDWVVSKTVAAQHPATHCSVVSYRSWRSRDLAAVTARRPGREDGNRRQ